MEAETNDCRIVLFLILIIQGGHGLYMCGMIQIDTKTHTCIQGVVQPISSVTELESILQMERFMYCEIQLFDTFKFDCKNGTILKNTTPTPATTTSTTSVAQPTTSSDSDRARALASSACRSNQKYLLPIGFDCCYDLAYRPEDQTCCCQSGICEVFNVSQHDHVCCNEVEGFGVHPRGSIDLPCQHSSTNDNFFTKMRHFNPSKIPDADFHRIYEETKFRKKKHRSNNISFFLITFRMFFRMARNSIMIMSRMNWTTTTKREGKVAVLIV